MGAKGKVYLGGSPWKVGEVPLGRMGPKWAWLPMGLSGLYKPMEEAVTAMGSGGSPPGRKGKFVSLLSSSLHYFAAVRR